MVSQISSLWLILSLFTLRALAACASYGVDYVNGGSYDIDASSNDNFTFTTIFQGCDQESVKPILIDPSGGQHPCSAISTTPAGTQVTSTCEIRYSAMSSGLYKIIISGSAIGVQRTIALTVGTPDVITITATPTVIVGVTSTPNATTIYKTIAQTLTSTLPPATVTTPCDGTTQTLTITPTAPTITSTYLITRTVTDKEVTSYSTTTITKKAYCHYLIPPSFTIPDPAPTICIGLACLPSVGVTIVPDTAAKTGKVNAVTAAAASVAATTVTVTETTYTVTSTSVTTVPASTTTEDVYQTIIATITPAPTTKCDDSRPPRTVTITKPFATVTQTDVDYTTSHVEATVWVEKTSYKTSTDQSSKTSCSRNGGWYGADGSMPVTATA
ncbi:hypothetical protein F5Y00DRAFT_257746 [Daldinia vernicosa]|uniref:uncharacterized protein n=1 Tax=Daldinia vernicosa TaxID=114800 RepID=UPI002008A9CF|nr:uncharacterized protein F5Y00DRAFT_257746 [Daldinia vernicosa]KAI0853094.1 hypothetical protein F5Y00DRAFT_257746 [Daldinia vernicosa]